ncbi:MAG: hypothetical protein KME16_17010 [Scytolyngbya sp. HA4215-MV1]|jgi:small-conductance mechanosensitive channel|nr:hypothetical protein [Scytolyngbya sp. HA4215-MV1]
MLHLAQVQKKGLVGKAELRLLARQKSENIWAVIPDEDTLVSTEAESLVEGLLVLVEVSSDRQILNITEAKNWVLDLIQKYLINGITPTFLKQEAQRAEQWRQSLTLQSQELDRRALELEARREQIQNLEDNFKYENQELDRRALELEVRREQLQNLEDHLKHENQELDRRALELEARREQLQNLEDHLKHEKKQLDLKTAQFKSESNPTN